MEEVAMELLSLIGLLASVYLALFLQIIIHEAGHLIFGLISGYDFLSFRIGSFMIVKENEKMKIKKFNLAGTLGQCLMSPPDMKEGKFPNILYNLGGTLLNVLSAIIFIVLYRIIDVSIIKEFTIILIIFGIIIALTNGIPIHTKLIDNDGYNALTLHKNPNALRAFWIQLKCNEMQMRGFRLKDMPEEWFEIPKDGEMKEAIVSTIGVFACNRLMDEHKFDLAYKNMEHLLSIDSSIAGIYRGLMLCDCMYCRLIDQNKKEDIESLYTKEQKNFMKSMKDYPSVMRTEYVIALIYNADIEGARKIKNKFYTISKTYPYPSDIESESELIEIVDSHHKNDK